jgi:nitrite reductase/ring-hydroxylating ferredoxin subunit
MTPPEPDLHPLCNSADLAEGGLACPFDVRYQGQTCRAFALRWRGRVHGYVNRCSHVAMEMDWRPNHFFDLTGLHIVCASHGARFRPDTGTCVGGPGRGPLIKIEMVEHDGVVFWRSQYSLRAIEF